MSLFSQLRSLVSKFFGVEFRVVGETQLNQANQANQADQANQANQADQANQANQAAQPNVLVNSNTTVATPPAPVAPAVPQAPRPTGEAKGNGTLSIPTPTMPFVSSEIMVSLPSLTANQLDELDFGCVKVNDKGLVEMYNLWESEFAGVPQETAMGRNFFRELAPCTNNRLIFGRFKEGVEQDNLNTIVSYAFTYKMRPTLVKVHLYRDPATKTNWVLVQKHDARPAK